MARQLRCRREESALQRTGTVFGMSIVVAVRVGEGLVVAADSAATLHARTPDGRAGVAKVFNNATKMLQLRDYPIAVASWGGSRIGSRLIASLVEEFANQRPPLEELDDEELSVEQEASDLADFLVSFYEKTFPDWEAMDQPPGGLGVLVGGYSGTGFFPEEYVFNIPHRQFMRLRPPKDDGSQDFGANWYGATDAIVRLHHGRDERMFEALKQLDVEQKKVDQLQEIIKRQFQYTVPFDGMPLQDAVDYAMYLVTVTVGRYRFVIGPEVCGGPIDVAAITRDRGFKWVRRKQLAIRAVGPHPGEEA